MKINYPELYDIIIRALKTGLQATLAQLALSPLSLSKQALISVAAAGVSAILNFIVNRLK